VLGHVSFVTFCVHPQKLAEQKGWIDKGWTSDIYGGLYVELSKPDLLPPSGRHLEQSIFIKLILIGKCPLDDGQSTRLLLAERSLGFRNNVVDVTLNYSAPRQAVSISRGNLQEHF
jgi:hypothetical protein